jgi:hypothetical protein
MILLWTSIAALSLAWFAGDAVLGLLVAPRLFHHAAEAGIGTAFPGLVFGDLLGRWVTVAGILLVIPIVGLLAAVAGRALKQRGWKAAMLPMCILFLVLSAHVTSVTVVKQGLQTAAELRERPDPERAERFRTSYHTRSRIVFSAEMLAALGLAIGAAIAAHRARSKA